jgi:hypothetical protein
MNTIESQLDPLLKAAPPLPLNTREQLKAQIEAEIHKWQAWLEKVEALPGLETLDLPAYVHCGQQIDFDSLTHPDIIRVLQAMGGKWDKSLSGCDGAIDYTQEINGVKIRLWAGEAPPNCRIIEIEETIPAQPERKEIRRKLQCV